MGYFDDAGCSCNTADYLARWRSDLNDLALHGVVQGVALTTHAESVALGDRTNALTLLDKERGGQKIGANGLSIEDAVAGSLADDLGRIGCNCSRESGDIARACLDVSR